MELTHIDLFSGMGGFALACKWAGIETGVFCEKDDRCRGFLERTYPDIPIIHDIREFDGTKWRGRFLLTGGVPCQPASRAGKQRGKGDDRWLWPEAIRVVDEAKPSWCLFENPPGIYDVGLDGILDDLESIGYEVGTVEIPACAVNSPQIRQRVWILANSQGRQNYSGRDGNMAEAEGCREGSDSTIGGSSQGDMADTGQKYGQWGPTEQNTGGDIQGERHEAANDFKRTGDMADTESNLWGTSGNEGSISFNGTNNWSRYIWTPCADGKLRRTPDDSFGLVDGLHRSVLAALGNSIVPQVAYEIIKAIKETDG